MTLTSSKSDAHDAPPQPSNVEPIEISFVPYPLLMALIPVGASNVAAVEDCHIVVTEPLPVLEKVANVCGSTVTVSVTTTVSHTKSPGASVEVPTGTPAAHVVKSKTEKTDPRYELGIRMLYEMKVLLVPRCELRIVMGRAVVRLKGLKY